MNTDKRDSKRLKMLNQRLWDRYGDRIALAGRLAPQSQYTRFYCFECENFFMQRVFSLTVRKCHPRCLCPPSNPHKRFELGDNPKSRGHRCLPEWDQWDLEKPERLTCRPE